MKKADYVAWQTMPLTKEIFALIKLRQKDQNDDFLAGRLMKGTHEENLAVYYKLMGYNRALEDMQSLAYEDLVDAPEELTEEKENEDDGSTKNTTV